MYFKEGWIAVDVLAEAKAQNQLFLFFTERYCFCFSYERKPYHPLGHISRLLRRNPVKSIDFFLESWVLTSYEALFPDSGVSDRASYSPLFRTLRFASKYRVSSISDISISTSLLISIWLFLPETYLDWEPSISIFTGQLCFLFIL